MITASVAMLPARVFAAEHHVTVGGTPRGDGSEAAPWDLATAFGHPEAVLPGDTIWIHAGTYPIVGHLASYLNGTAEAPIVVRAAIGERVTLDTGDSASNGIAVEGGHTWIWGLEIMSSAEDRWADDGQAADRGYSIDANNGEGIKLINLIVHDTQGQIGFWSGVTNGEVYGALIYYNGFDFSERGRGHGIYAQNETGTKRLVDNIIFGAYDYGIHVYTEGGFIDGFYLEGNISFSNGFVSTVNNGATNILIGGSPVANDPELRENYTYFEPGDGGPSCNLGYGAGTSNARVHDNVFVGSNNAFSLLGPNADVTDNVFVGPTEGVDAGTFPDNTYEAPTGATVIVRPNAYEEGRGHIAIYNWDQADEVDVDLSEVLVAGDVYEVRDAQNFFAEPIATGTFSGDPIAIPMTSTAVADVIGEPSTPHVHTSPAFGAFVLLKTGEDPGGGESSEGGSDASTGSDGGETTSGTTASSDSTSSTTATTTAGTSGGSDTDDAAADEADGCGCGSTPPSGASLLLIAIAFFRRRR